MEILHPYIIREVERQKNILEVARLRVAELVNADKESIIFFTSEQPEANNIVVNSFDNLITSKLSMSLFLNTAKSIDIDVTPEGYVDLNHLDEVTKNIKNKEKSIISVMIANNETELFNPLRKQLKKIAKK